MKITFLVITLILVVQSVVAQFDSQYQAITSTLFECGEEKVMDVGSTNVMQ